MSVLVPARLVRALSLARSEDELISLAQDLFTDRELMQVEDRIQACELLLQGKSQAAVSRETNISRVTAGRAAQVLSSGNGMIEIVLQRANEDSPQG